MEFKVECSKRSVDNDLSDIGNIWTIVCIYKTEENVIS